MRGGVFLLDETRHVRQQHPQKSQMAAGQHAMHQAEQIPQQRRGIRFEDGFSEQEGLASHAAGQVAMALVEQIGDELEGDDEVSCILGGQPCWWCRGWREVVLVMLVKGAVPCANVGDQSEDEVVLMGEGQ